MAKWMQIRSWRLPLAFVLALLMSSGLAFGKEKGGSGGDHGFKNKGEHQGKPKFNPTPSAVPEIDAGTGNTAFALLVSGLLMAAERSRWPRTPSPSSKPE